MSPQLGPPIPSRPPAPSRRPLFPSRSPTAGDDTSSSRDPRGDELPHRLRTKATPHPHPLDATSRGGRGHPQPSPLTGPVSPGVPTEGWLHLVPPLGAFLPSLCLSLGISRGTAQGLGTGTGTGPPATSPGCRRPRPAREDRGRHPPSLRWARTGTPRCPASPWGHHEGPAGAAQGGERPSRGRGDQVGGTSWGGGPQGSPGPRSQGELGVTGLGGGESPRPHSKAHGDIMGRGDPEPQVRGGWGRGGHGCHREPTPGWMGGDGNGGP